MLPRILPFALYMGFIAISALVDWLAENSPETIADPSLIHLWLYPVKTAVVLLALVLCWSSYDELKGNPFGSLGNLGLSVLVGLVVYFLWVRMDWSWATQGEIGAGYNPFLAPGHAWLLAAIRLFGAAVVVPIMEELFWRSFIIRYLVNPDFKQVRLGTYTLLSFAATVVLFGVEHNLWLAGMMAGIAYNLLLYRTNRLWPCILAHGLTNLVLGLHVLAFEEWWWW